MQLLQGGLDASKFVGEAGLPVVVLGVHHGHEGSVNDVHVPDVVVGDQHHSGGLGDVRHGVLLFSQARCNVVLDQLEGVDVRLAPGLAQGGRGGGLHIRVGHLQREVVDCSVRTVCPLCLTVKE